MVATQPANVAVGDQIAASHENNNIAWWGGSFASYTPVLQAVTTNPTLGSGSAVQGRYVQVGKFVFARVAISFGTSGTNAGNGLYSISLPVAPANPAQTSLIGRGRIICAGLASPVDALISAAGTLTLAYINAAFNGSLIGVNHNTPGAWTANDLLQMAYWYEAA